MLIVLLGLLAIISFHAFNVYSKNDALTSVNDVDVLKPDVKTFLLYGFAKSFFSSFVLFGILFVGARLLISFIGNDIPEAKSFILSANYLWGILVLCALFSYISLSVQYKKEQYFFHKDKLIHKGGGIFSDFERELSVKNITHVTMMLPLIENTLFGTGYIRIESAGALTSEIFLRAIAKPKMLYDKAISIMKNNGFRLNRNNLIRQEKPHPLAVFFEVFGSFMGIIFFILWIVLAITDESKLDLDKLVAEHGSLMLGGVGLILFGILTFCFFHFLDLKKRIYELYEDTIAYTEGFLNKNYSFIPIENLADSAVTQSIPSRIFGLYDVKISCQGSGQEILFKNIENGEVLSEDIDNLIGKSKSLIKEESKEYVSDAVEGAPVAKPTTRKVEVDREYKDEFRMKNLRTWMPAILLSPLLIIIFPAGIIVAINNMIAIACNVFRVKSDSIEHTFSFLSKKTKEFSLDKVTGIVVKESFIDKWCKTCSILFWSIGSDENVTFSNIKKTDQLREKILAKKGIREQNVLYSLNSSYDLASMVEGNLYAYLFFALLIVPCFIFFPFYGFLSLATLLAGCVVTFIYRTFYYKNSKIVFYEDYVHFIRGLFFIEDYFVYYDDIKDISTTKFPFSNRGNVSFNVAGELVVKTQNGESITSNSFTIRFVDDISSLDELVDAIFYQRPSVSKINEIKRSLKDTSSKPEYSTKPCLTNYLLFVLPVVAVVDLGTIITYKWVSYQPIPTWLIGVLGAFTIVVIGATVITIRAISYNIQPYRVYERSGVIFKKQLSITFNKMDFINISQGPINKIFGNGNITINTVGSSKPELTINNVKDFKKFYEIVKSRYK